MPIGNSTKRIVIRSYYDKKVCTDKKVVQSYYGTKVRIPVAIQFHETMFNIVIVKTYMYI